MGNETMRTSLTRQPERARKSISVDLQPVDSPLTTNHVETTHTPATQLQPQAQRPILRDAAQVSSAVDDDDKNDEGDFCEILESGVAVAATNNSNKVSNNNNNNAKANKVSDEANNNATVGTQSPTSRSIAPVAADNGIIDLTLSDDDDEEESNAQPKTAAPEPQPDQVASAPPPTETQQNKNNTWEELFHSVSNFREFKISHSNMNLKSAAEMAMKDKAEDGLEYEQIQVEGDGRIDYYSVAKSVSRPRKVYGITDGVCKEGSVLQKGLCPGVVEKGNLVYDGKRDSVHALYWHLISNVGDAGFWLCQSFPEEIWKVMEGDRSESPPKYLMVGGTRGNPFATLMRLKGAVYACLYENGMSDRRMFQLLPYDPYDNPTKYTKPPAESSDSYNNQMHAFASRTSTRKRDVSSSSEGACGSCPACLRRDDCGNCDICTKKTAAPSSSVCLGRVCTAPSNSNSPNKKKQKTAKNKGKDDDSNLNTWPQVGDRVYAKWPETGQWYWGTVHSFVNKGKKSKYHIKFDDGDERDDAKFEEFITMDIWKLLQREQEEKTRKREEAERKKREEEEKKIEEERNREKALKDGEPFVGSRCYAEFHDNLWYFGEVSVITGEGETARYSVQFDDGDSIENLRRHALKTLPEYEESLYLPDYSSLESQRCQRCGLCRKKDCGSCTSCLANKKSTTTMKECCLLKICPELGFKKSAQPIPNFPAGWVYHFTFGPRPSDLPPALHPSLNNFRITNLGSKSDSVFFCLRSAGKSAGVSREDVDTAEVEIYQKRLGLDILIPDNDDGLIGKGFCFQWNNLRGNHCCLYGVVKLGFENYFNKKVQFSVEFDRQSLSLVDGPAIPQIASFSQQDTWGGCVLFERKTGFSTAVQKSLIDKVFSFQPTDWLSPENVTYELLPADHASDGFPRPKKTIIFRGWCLELETRESLIPNAGLGVFIKCSHIAPRPSGMSRTRRETFKLETGEMLDIGIYAPLSQHDKKSNTVHLFKDYIHDNICESWSFDPPDHQCKHDQYVFDITDDATGKLRQTARRSLATYVNETNGIDTPSISALYDPQHCVHYMLGHREKRDGPLKLPKDEWIEIKVDYGEGYENVRVKRGYSRLGEDERRKKEKAFELDHIDTLKDMHVWSVNDIEDCVAFLERLPLPIHPGRKEVRAIAALLCFYLRLISVKKDFEKFPPGSPLPDTCCDCGYSTMDQKQVIFRVQKLLQKYLSLWSDDRELKHDLLSEDLASSCSLGKLLHRDTHDLQQLSGSALREQIEQEVLSARYLAS